MEPLIRQDLEGDVVRLSLATGTSNHISPALLDALDKHVGDLETDPPRAVMIDGGNGNLFSGGFDLKAILAHNRREMLYFMRHFNALVARLTELPAPTVAALHGHAIASGFIIPLACDFRIVQTGALKLGLGEVDLGIPVPAGAQVLLRARTSPGAALRLSMFATLMTPEEATEVGYADMLADNAQLEALDLARTLADKPGAGVTLTKHFTANPLAAEVRAANDRGIHNFLDCWFSDVAQDRLHALAERL